MKVVYCVRYGSHEDLEVREIDPPGTPGEGQVKVDIEARGIQFSDLVRIAGNYQDKSELPFVVGGEAAGLVTEISRQSATDVTPGESPAPARNRPMPTRGVLVRGFSKPVRRTGTRRRWVFEREVRG